jgi:nickel-dependent lactate racemase
MEVELAYGKNSIKLEIPDDVEVDIFAPAVGKTPIGFDDFSDELEKAGADSFLNASSLLFIVNDGYRNTPTSQLLDWLDRRDRTILDRARFLISTGTHGQPTEQHLRNIFGKFYDKVATRVQAHDCRDISSMQPIGKDKFGGEVYLNKAYFEAERVCAIGSVEPHYFAGYTGGRKSLIPGLTDFSTVERNHNLANSLEAAPMKLSGNPVAEHLDEMLGLVDATKCLSFQIVMDAQRNIAGLFAGDIRSSFERAVECAAEIFGHTIGRQYDTVMCEVLPPLDGNLYQAQKGLENCQQAVIDGGTAVVVSACAEGIGSQHFWDLANGWNRTDNRPGDGKLHFGSHKLSRVNEMRKRITPAIHCELSPDQVRKVFYEPLDDLDSLISKKQLKYRLAIVHDAGNTVLRT